MDFSLFTERDRAVAVLGIMSAMSDEGSAGHEAIQYALNAIKRLTPTAPTGDPPHFYSCPHCSRPILKSAADGEPRHCENCGQAILWE